VVRRRTRDERPQSTQHRPAKIAWNTPGIYYPHGCSGAASSSLGQEVAHCGTDEAPKEEKRAREEPRRGASRATRTRESRLHSARPPRIIPRNSFPLVARPIMRLDLFILFTRACVRARARACKRDIINMLRATTLRCSMGGRVTCDRSAANLNYSISNMT